MKINIELNSKELDILSKDSKDPISYEFLIDVYTESRKELSPQEETMIFTGVFWALCTMLPSTIIHTLFKQWNELVKQLTQGLNEGKTVAIKNLDEIDPT
jgi:hypothetical protein